jgi:hypothetical protein
MSERPNRDEGHLVVAAVRVLEHLRQHPPTEEEVAELLQWHEDRGRVIVRELRDMGVLDALVSPFEVRYQIRDHRLLDELEESEDVKGTIAKEMADFDQRSQEAQDHLEKMFGIAQKNSKPAPKTGLEDDFDSFAQRKPKDPFGGG